MYWLGATAAPPQADDFRAAVIKALAVFVGPDEAARRYDQGIAAIQMNAGKGAEKAVKPYIIGALALGGAGVVIGTMALLRSRNRRYA